MKLKLFVFVLFSTVPGLLAMGTGAPAAACGDLMPRHGATSQPSNNGYFIISDAVNDYDPGQEYLGTRKSITRCYATLLAAVFTCAMMCASRLKRGFTCPFFLYTSAVLCCLLSNDK